MNEKNVQKRLPNESTVNTMQNEPLEESRASSERQREREAEVQEAPRGAQSGPKDPKRHF